MKIRQVSRTEAYKGIYDTPVDAPDYDVCNDFETAQCKKILEGKCLSGTGDRLYSTSERLCAYWRIFKKQRERVAAECDPQDVYDYEFYSRECECICCDRRAMEHVILIFGMERAKKVERRHGYISLEKIDERIPK